MTLLKERGRSDDNDARAFSFKATRLRNALNFSGIGAASILFPMRCHSVGCGTTSQTQLGFQSTLIVERLRGQGYGDFPWHVVHSFSTAQSTNRLSDTIECSQPLPKNFNPKFSTLSIQKHYPTPEWYAGCSCSHDAVIRVYDATGA